MLRTLHIRDFVIVDELELDFAPGFTVFSGETGAGKSILIDALALALGERADAGVVREGAARAEIGAEFDLDAGLAAWLTEHGFAAEGSLLLRRVVDGQGRSKAYVNGSAATLTQLRELGDRLVDIQGQHAHQLLLRADAQRHLVDAHGGLGGQTAEVGEIHRQWQGVRKRIAQLELDARGLELERDRLAWQVEELDRLALQDGEWDQLQAEHKRLAHAASLIEGAQAAVQALDTDDQSISSQLGALEQRLSHLAEHDAALKDVAASLEAASIAVQEAVSDLNAYLGRVEVDPARLAEIDARLEAIYGTARKLKLQPAQLPAHQQSVRAQLADLQGHSDLEALQREESQLAKRYAEAAAALTARRAAVAKKLSQAVTQAMQTLGMQGGRLAVELFAAEPSASGSDRIEFQVAGHAGVSPKPLAKVASGGELARISLAIAVIASTAAQVPTLIFDEVDAGIGGATAEVVGKLLRDLGSRHQVLCVTHLPQVAAQGNQHLGVAKKTHKGRTLSHIRVLDGAERVDEIARMLGGMEITSTSRKHAREMLAA
jgi:DNA repair protein RecN (Recombination protein N)